MSHSGDVHDHEAGPRAGPRQHQPVPRPVFANFLGRLRRLAPLKNAASAEKVLERTVLAPLLVGVAVLSLAQSACRSSVKTGKACFRAFVLFVRVEARTPVSFRTLLPPLRLRLRLRLWRVLD